MEPETNAHASGLRREVVKVAIGVTCACYAAKEGPGENEKSLSASTGGYIRGRKMLDQKIRRVEKLVGKGVASLGSTEAGEGS